MAKESSISKYLKGHRWLLCVDGALTERDIYRDYLSFCLRKNLEIYGYIPFANAMMADSASDNSPGPKRRRFVKD